MSRYIFFYTSVSHLVIKLVEKLLNLGKISQKIEENNRNRWKIDQNSIKSIKNQFIDKRCRDPLN